MQPLLFPMPFPSGALFPLSGLPNWLTVITRINPLTHAVAPLRQVVFAAQHTPAAAAARFAGGVTLFGSTLSNTTCIGITGLFAAVFLALAVAGFGKE
jgi:ABC-2 type transport system permease protein